MQKQWSEFVKWLEEQPPDRAFKNGSSSQCVGHMFCYEVCHDYNANHLIYETDEILPGFARFFEQEICHCPHTGDGDYQYAKDILKIAKEFKS